MKQYVKNENLEPPKETKKDKKKKSKDEGDTYKKKLGLTENAKILME